MISKTKYIKAEEIRNAANFDKLLDIKYGKIGTKKRDTFEEKAERFVAKEILKDAKHISFPTRNK